MNARAARGYIDRSVEIVEAIDEDIDPLLSLPRLAPPWPFSVPKPFTPSPTDTDISGEVGILPEAYAKVVLAVVVVVAVALIKQVCG